jgi:uncharacterized protein (TIGR03435 family)
MAKLAADMQQGKMPKMGAHVDNSRAEYNYVALRDLIALAYGVKPFQVTGPDWITKDRFDIVAKLPEGARKEDAPKMLQMLLEERFKLAMHRTKEEHPVLGLVVGKGGPKLKESAETPKPLDASIPLKPGEMIQEGPNGPVRVTMGKLGSAVINMGEKGLVNYGMNPATQSMRMEGSMITMSGFADMLTQFMQMSGGGGRQVVDMTNLKGHYEVALEFGLADLLQMARANGMDIPAGAGRGAGPIGASAPSDAASDPGGGASSVTQAVSALGLKLESRKAPVDQLIVDHLEKTPTQN